MSNRRFLRFSDRDEEIANLFFEIGIGKNSSKVLALLIRELDFSSRDMERICDLRQPEVSIALKDLITRGWVKIVRHVIENKGRPVSIYHLGKTLDEILDDIKGMIIGDSGRKIIDIERIRDLLKTEQQMI
ncbi:hypothetical protein ACKUB1_15330 [Methanospirillum stamsii]|uniref:ArsR family transcriptional regulator n=1 Tax=Methanospirillum stamsii TaxID=1277351 RepID=A0A2V2N552_9EURY|nr:hypothetical protein [Methanospirillum stamsii]PWR75214.1 hypothetical protein DLD82_05325 [Methanospirillum stamsii]